MPETALPWKPKAFLLRIFCSRKGGGVMTKIFSMAVALVMLLGMDTVCSAGASRERTASGGAAENEVVIAVNGTRVRAILYDNSAARSFRKLLPYTVSVTVSPDLKVTSAEPLLP